MKLPRPLALLGAIFGSRKTAPDDQTPAYTLEHARLVGDEADYSSLPKAVAEQTSFTEEEKGLYYAARESLRWLPTFGPNGCWLQTTADRVTALGLPATKQYVNQVLWPRDPKRLFLTRTATYKQIWVQMANLVAERLQADPTLLAYSELLEKLDQGLTVWVRNMKTSRLDLLSNKCTAEGLVVHAYAQTSKVPYDFLFVPAPRPEGQKRAIPGTGSLTVEDVQDDLLSRIRANHVAPVWEIELVSWNRAYVDTFFPQAVSVERLGKHHYMIELVAA